MSRSNRSSAGAASEGTESALPTLTPVDGPDPGSGAGANAAAEFVENDVVAMNHALREEVDRLRADVVSRDRGLDEMHARFTAEVDRLKVELHGAEAALALGRQNYAELQARRAELAERNGGLTAENAALRGEIRDALARAPLGTFAETVLGHRTRLVFDASVPGVDAEGQRVVFAPGTPVPDHIDPDSLPAHAVKRVPEEG